MLTVRPYLTTTSGAVSEKYLKTAQTVYGDVTVVSVDIHHRGPESLHPDRAVTLRLSGEFVDVKITQAKEYDLVGEAISDWD